MRIYRVLREFTGLDSILNGSMRGFRVHGLVLKPDKLQQRASGFHGSDLVGQVVADEFFWEERKHIHIHIYIYMYVYNVSMHISKVIICVCAYIYTHENFQIPAALRRFDSSKVRRRCGPQQWTQRLQYPLITEYSLNHFRDPTITWALEYHTLILFFS